MIVVIASLDWQLAIVALGVAPVLFVLSRAFGQQLRHRWTEIKKLDSSAMSVVQEVLVLQFASSRRLGERSTSTDGSCSTQQNEFRSGSSRILPGEF